MFTPDSTSSKYLTPLQGEAEVDSRSFDASELLRDNAPGRVKIRWNTRTGISQSVRGILTEPGQGSGTEIADQFLMDNHALFGLSDDTSDLYYVEVKERRGSEQVKYQQRYKDLAVVGSEMTVYIDQAKRVQMVNGSYCPGIDLDTTTPLIAETAAVEAVLETLETEESSEAQLELVVFPKADQYILAYQVMLQTKNPLGDWIFFVDASSAIVVDGYNAIHFAKGTGHAYNTNPKRDDSVITVKLFELDESRTLSGTYFSVQNKEEGRENASPTGPGTHDFLYADPAAPHFDEVMVYYHLNKVAEFFRNLGHAEHTTQMDAYVHVPNPSTGSPNYDNAYFSSFDKAIYFGHGDVLNDLAKEAAVIYHEYSHSIVDAIQPFMGIYEAGALHEGYADYFACSLTNDPKIGEFAVGQISAEYLRDLRGQKTYEVFTGTDVHVDGAIWGSICWDIHETLGRRTADLLMYEGLWFLPQNATFVDAYEGILQADSRLFGGAHLEELETIFKEAKISVEPPVAYTIVATAGIGGTISPSGTITVLEGETQSFTIQASPGYYGKHLLIDGVSVGAVTDYTFEPLSASHTIEAFFESEAVTTYTVMASAGEGGSISPSGQISVDQGENLSFTITPDTSYIITHVVVDGISVGAVSAYSFENITTAHVIEGFFEQRGQEHTVIVPANRAWLDSGILLEIGDVISLAASGVIGYNSKGNSCGPGGTSWTDEQQRKDPLWQNPHAGLIGKIEGIGAPFFIGEAYTVRAGSSGKLLLGINDYWYQNNSGEFTVTIRLLET